MQVADLYIRVSTDEQADKGYSQRHQEEMLQKYCNINGISVRKTIFEDHSAKNFMRPEWQKLLLDLKKKRGQVDLILFTKWDRFSRNAGDAYQEINTLRKFGVEPQAVEQPLDLSIPENKMMLAFYLAAPEVENDRRALNTFYGMRRAKKEGRWMSTAPVGYANKITEGGRKYIAPKEPIAGIMHWAFEQIAEGVFNTESVWRMAKSKGLNCSKNAFWMAIRNPIYCGKIFIPKFKDEDSCLVAGLHEPIISERLFNDVQDVLDGRKRIFFTTKVEAEDHLPLRGFLICPKCGRMLTGSASKGRNSYYHYYHCLAKCGTRFKADDANDKFVKELRKYIPAPGISEIYQPLIISVFKGQTKSQNSERSQLLRQISDLNERLKNSREMVADKIMDADDFRILKSETNKKIDELENKLANLSNPAAGIEKLLQDAVTKLSNLDVLYLKGTAKERREIIGSIFPENLTFDGTQYRTTRLNEAARCIWQIINELEGNKNGTNDVENHLSRMVARTGVERRSKMLYGKGFRYSKIVIATIYAQLFISTYSTKN